ncbi:uncharacterized protein LOC132556373, partial [Ylistrum balloti]
MLLYMQQTVRTSDTESLSEYMWNKTEAIRNKTLSSYFVQGIANGSLNPTALGGYMVQDSVYCYEVKHSIDISVDRATDGELKEYLRMKSASYERYYKDLFNKWRIESPTGINLSKACESYVDYERKVAATEDTIYMIVAMIPCMKLWPWLGQQVQS